MFIFLIGVMMSWTMKFWFEFGHILKNCGPNFTKKKFVLWNLSPVLTTLKITLPLTKVTSHLGSTTCWYWILILKCPTVNWFSTFFLPFFERKTRMVIVVIYCNLNKFHHWSIGNHFRLWLFIQMFFRQMVFCVSEFILCDIYQKCSWWYSEKNS